MDKKEFKKGVKMFFGVPANPMSKALVDVIAQSIVQIPDISEAYLPQCYIEGEKEARQVLVIGVGNDKDIPDIMQNLINRMKLSLPSEARVKECKIFGDSSHSSKKAW